MSSRNRTWIDDVSNNEYFKKEHSVSACYDLKITNLLQFITIYCENESENLKLICRPMRKSPNGKSAFMCSSSVLLEEEIINVVTSDDTFEKGINELRKVRLEFEEKYQLELILRKNDLMEIEIVFWK